MPSVFVRTAGCNLDCKWCDTKYAQKGHELPMSEIVEKVREFPCQYVVITGGEPLVQPATLNLCNRLSNLNYHTTVETNGTLNIPMPDVLGIDLLSISPKLSNSQVDTQKRLKVETVKELTSYGIDYYLKFVVENQADIIEMETAWLSQLNVPPSLIYLMPQAITSERAIALGKELVEVCKQKGYRLSPRLQTIYWGAKRSV